jgi:hypothetical protein
MILDKFLRLSSFSSTTSIFFPNSNGNLDSEPEKRFITFANAPDYAKYKTGFIGLQDHGSNLYFRNIKIKKL